MSDLITKSINHFRNLYWLDKYLAGHDGFIAGGCFKNIFNEEKIKDIDIFFKSNEDYVKAKNYFENHDKYNTYYENQKVTAFKDSEKNVSVELIYSVFGTPEEIINNFDFSITKFAYYKEKTKDDDGEEHITDKVIYHKDFFEHLHLKRLVTNDILTFPVSTFERLFKYAKYGYYPCKETKMHIINNIKNSNNEGDLLSESLYQGLD